MVGRQRRAVGHVGQQDIVIVEHLERHVGGVALLGVGDHEVGRLV